MFTKTALTAAIIIGTASSAFAFEYDANLANRYPAFAGPAAAQTQVSSRPRSRCRPATFRPAAPSSSSVAIGVVAVRGGVG